MHNLRRVSNMHSGSGQHCWNNSLTDYRQWNGANGIGVKILIVYFIKTRWTSSRRDISQCLLLLLASAIKLIMDGREKKFKGRIRSSIDWKSTKLIPSKHFDKRFVLFSWNYFENIKIPVCPAALLLNNSSITNTILLVKKNYLNNSGESETTRGDKINNKNIFQSIVISWKRINCSPECIWSGQTKN